VYRCHAPCLSYRLASVFACRQPHAALAGALPCCSGEYRPLQSPGDPVTLYSVVIIPGKLLTFCAWILSIFPITEAVLWRTSLFHSRVPATALSVSACHIDFLRNRQHCVVLRKFYIFFAFTLAQRYDRVVRIIYRDILLNSCHWHGRCITSAYVQGHHFTATDCDVSPVSRVSGTLGLRTTLSRLPVRFPRISSTAVSRPWPRNLSFLPAVFWSRIK
jgi:hypothetical protein